MNSTYQYCSERSDLEQRTWDLVSRLYALTVKLMALVGKDRTEFMTIRTSCANTREEISEAQDRLADHRDAHGC